MFCYYWNIDLIYTKIKICTKTSLNFRLILFSKEKKNYTSNSFRIINIWYITISKIINSHSLVENFFTKYFSWYLYETIHKNGKEVTRDRNRNIITKLKLKLRSSDIFPRYMIEFMVESMFQLYAQETKFHFRNNYYTLHVSFHLWN